MLAINDDGDNKHTLYLYTAFLLNISEDFTDKYFDFTQINLLFQLYELL